MPVPYEQTPTGTFLVKEAKVASGQVALYARVSGNDQKSDLHRQFTRLVEYANGQGWAVAMVVTEIGSGLDGHRPELMHLLADPKIKTVVVEHRDRLMRFGYESAELALAAQGR